MAKFKAQFVGSWGSEVDVATSFGDDSVLDYDIIIAGYFQEDYEGSAYVLARKDGHLFEVEGGHCSCNGLEDDQWTPAVVTEAYLRNRLEKGSFPSGDGVHIDDLVRQFLDRRKRKKQ